MAERRLAELRMAELRPEQAPETSAHIVENRPARNRQQPRKSHDNNHYAAVPIVLGLFGELRLRTRQRGLHQPRRRLRRRQSAEFARNRPPSPQFVRAGDARPHMLRNLLFFRARQRAGCGQRKQFSNLVVLAHCHVPPGYRASSASRNCSSERRSRDFAVDTGTAVTCAISSIFISSSNRRVRTSRYIIGSAAIASLISVRSSAASA